MKTNGAVNVSKEAICTVGEFVQTFSKTVPEIAERFELKAKYFDSADFSVGTPAQNEDFVNAIAQAKEILKTFDTKLSVINAAIVTMAEGLGVSINKSNKSVAEQMVALQAVSAKMKELKK